MNKFILSILILFFAHWTCQLQAQDDQAVFLYASAATVEPNEEFCIDIYAFEIEAIRRLRFGLNWRRDLIGYQRIEIPEPTAGGLTNLSEEDFNIDLNRGIYLDWADAEGYSTTSPDSTVLFSVCFIAQHTVETTTTVSLANELGIVQANSAIDNSPVPVAMRSGEINLTIPERTAQLRIGSTTVSPYENACIPVTAINVGDVTSMQFAIEWDETLLRFDELTNNVLQTDDIFSNYSVHDNIFRLAWFDSTGETASLGDSTILFDLCFETLSPDPVNIPVNFSTDLAIEVVSINENNEVELVPISPKNGFIRTENGFNASRSIQVEQNAAATGEDVCMKVKANDLDAVAGMQFALRWDETQLVYRDIQLEDNELELSDLNYHFDGEQLRFLWTNMEAENLNLAGETELFDICFTVIGEQDTTYIQYSDILPAEVPTIVNRRVEKTNVSTIEGILLIDDNVLPGDTDLDKEVNHYDLLNIGLGYGTMGAMRPDTSITFEPKEATDWTTSTPMTQVNYKHLDTNGDGTIDSNDLEAIEENWSAMPTLSTTVQSSDGIPFYVDADTLRLQDGQLPIVLGDAERNAQQLYGIAFSLYFDLSEDLSVAPTVSLNDSWLGTTEELIQVHRFFPAEQRLDVSVSRIDQMARDGQGELAAINIVMEDVILFHANPKVRLDHVRAIGEVEQMIAINVNNKARLASSLKEVLDLPISITPNPATSDLFIQTAHLQIEQVTILDAVGKVVETHSATSTLKVDHLERGMYFLIIQSDRGTITRKLSVQ